MAAIETTTSTHRMMSTTGVHLFKVTGHSLIKSASIRIQSKPFCVGGHDWVLDYYPYGEKYDGGKQEHTSVYIRLKDAGEATVRANVSFCLQADPGSPDTGTVKNILDCRTVDFSAKNKSWGFTKFVKKTDLATSGCLKDDCLVIKCTVEVIASDTFEGLGDDDDIIVPPSELSTDVGKILEDGLKADMTVKIGLLKTFRVHKCVLAARSPVFCAQLCGSMADSRRRTFSIDDIDVSVFEALLQYMYKDTAPAFMEEATEKARNMAQHLLVAADRYGMERLKLICESKLSKTLDLDTVGSTLDFAERHGCHQLKNCCVRYMARNRAKLATS
jgi:speckle-type POZ protein